MIDLSTAQRLELRRALAAWSDQAQKSAGKFADQHRDLLPRRITNAQLSGLYNIVQAAPAIKAAVEYIQHQGSKAEKAGFDDVPQYWRELEQIFLTLTPEAEKLLDGIGVAVPAGVKPKEYKDLVNQVALSLGSEWVQHLAAHSLFLNRP